MRKLSRFHGHVKECFAVIDKRLANRHYSRNNERSELAMILEKLNDFIVAAKFIDVVRNNIREKTEKTGRANFGERWCHVVVSDPCKKLLTGSGLETEIFLYPGLFVGFPELPGGCLLASHPDHCHCKSTGRESRGLVRWSPGHRRVNCSR